jgi:hypothetical protein
VAVVGDEEELAVLEEDLSLAQFGRLDVHRDLAWSTPPGGPVAVGKQRARTGNSIAGGRLPGLPDTGG